MIGVGDRGALFAQAGLAQPVQDMREVMRRFILTASLLTLITGPFSAGAADDYHATMQLDALRWSAPEIGWMKPRAPE